MRTIEEYATELISKGVFTGEIDEVVKQVAKDYPSKSSLFHCCIANQIASLELEI